MTELIDSGIKIGIIFLSIYHLALYGTLSIIRSWDSGLVSKNSLPALLILNVVINELVIIGIINLVEWTLGFTDNVILESWLGMSSFLVAISTSCLLIYITMRNEKTSSFDSFLLLSLTTLCSYLYGCIVFN